nr:hypothetical transcript [Hymenolepis microstoma]
MMHHASVTSKKRSIDPTPTSMRRRSDTDENTSLSSQIATQSVTGGSADILNLNLSSIGTGTPTVPSVSTKTEDLVLRIHDDEDPEVPLMQVPMPMAPQKDLTTGPQEDLLSTISPLLDEMNQDLSGVGPSSAFNRIRKRKQDKANEGVRETKFRHITISVDSIFLPCGIKQKLEGLVITPNYPTEVNLYNIPRHKNRRCAVLDPNYMSQLTLLESVKSKLIMSL